MIKITGSFNMKLHNFMEKIPQIYLPEFWQSDANLNI